MTTKILLDKKTQSMSTWKEKYIYNQWKINMLLVEEVANLPFLPP